MNRRLRGPALGLLVTLAVPDSLLAQTGPYARVTFFAEDFESGTLGPFVERICPSEPFTPYPALMGPCGTAGSTFWHATGICDACVVPPGPLHPNFGLFAAAYNRMDETPPNCTYETPGSANSGALESGPVFWPTWPPVPMQIALTFEFTKDTDITSVTATDRFYIEVDLGPGSCPSGSAWTVLADLGTTGYSCPGFYTATVVMTNHPLLDAMAGSDGAFRFRFDTVDATNNGMTGVYVDNIRLLNSFCGPCLAYETGGTYCLPRIESSGGAPRIGNGAYTLHLTNAPSTAAGAVLVLGLSHSFWGGASLPWNIPGTQGPFGTCKLCVSVDVMLPAPLTSGAGPCSKGASQPLGIPNAPVLVGGEAFAQWIVLDPLQVGGIVASDAAALPVQG